MESKYNFVFFTGCDYFDIAYSDIDKLINGQLLKRVGYNGHNLLCKLLYKIHLSNKVNRIIKLPFKKIWYPTFYKPKFINENPICFILPPFLEHTEYERNYIVYLKGKYPKSKFVSYYIDLVKPKNNAPLIEPFKIKDKYDLIISYDEGDAAYYGLEFFPTSFSDYSPEDDFTISESDVFFVGRPKSRLKDIIEIYKILSSHGLKCDFYILGVDENEKIALEGIHYIEKPMPYQENLKHVIKSRCLLEIMQENATGATLRTWEAINYGKCLITNNKSLDRTSFYSSRFVTIFSDAYKLDIPFIKTYQPFDNSLKMNIRPIKLLEFIEYKLSITDNYD